MASTDGIDRGGPLWHRLTTPAGHGRSVWPPTRQATGGCEYHRLMGPRDASAAQLACAREIGEGLAAMGLAVICGGRHG